MAVTAFKTASDSGTAVDSSGAPSAPGVGGYLMGTTDGIIASFNTSGDLADFDTSGNFDIVMPLPA